MKGTVMPRIVNLTDLGAATIETKGPIGTGFDDVLRQDAAGIADD